MTNENTIYNDIGNELSIAYYMVVELAHPLEWTNLTTTHTRVPVFINKTISHLYYTMNCWSSGVGVFLSSTSLFIIYSHVCCHFIICHNTMYFISLHLECMYMHSRYDIHTLAGCSLEHELLNIYSWKFT